MPPLNPEVRWLRRNAKHLDVKFTLQFLMIATSPPTHPDDDTLEWELICDRREHATGPLISLGEVYGVNKSKPFSQEFAQGPAIASGD